MVKTLVAGFVCLVSQFTIHYSFLAAPLTWLPAADRRSPAEQDGSNSPLELPKDNLTRKNREPWRRVLRWPDSCEEAFQYPDESFAGLRFYPLEPHTDLAEVTCSLGAYQGFQIYYLLDERRSSPTPSLLTFQTYEAHGEEEKSLVRVSTSELWGTPTFDPRTKHLTVLNRFRGLGDCGWLATYNFLKGTPALLEFRAKLRCDGRGAGDPHAWKKVEPE